MYQDTNYFQDKEPPQGGTALAHFKRAAKAEKPEETLTTLFLQPEDIPAFLKLQEKVLESLPLHQKSFLKERGESDLAVHLGSRMPIIGVKNEAGELVAQCLVAYPSNREAVRNLHGYPISDMEMATTAVVQSLCVDPAYKGRGLTEHVLDTAKAVAAQSGHVQLIAKVNDRNAGSRAAFLKNSFSVAAQGVDPRELYPVSYFRYSVFGCNATRQAVALEAKIA